MTSLPVARSLEFASMLERDRDTPVLVPLKRPCGDCAVTALFYSGISERLSLEPFDVQAFISERWFCHNHNRACRGNIDLLARLRRFRGAAHRRLRR